MVFEGRGREISSFLFSKKFNEEKTCEKNVKIVYESAKNKKENYYIIKVFSFCGFFFSSTFLFLFLVFFSLFLWIEGHRGMLLNFVQKITKNKFVFIPYRCNREIDGTKDFLFLCITLMQHPCSLFHLNTQLYHFHPFTSSYINHTVSSLPIP